MREQLSSQLFSYSSPRRRHRPFQGWRYLLPKDAPPDITDPKSAKNLPQSLKVELADLGLL